MSRLPAWLENYRALPKPVLLFASGQFLVNLTHVGQLLLLNLFLKDGGLDDPEIASLGAKRFVATFFFSIPAGLWLRGRPLRFPLIVAAAVFPVMALAALETARVGRTDLTAWFFLGMGAASLVLNIASLPMMLRMVPPDKSSETLSLLFAMWAASAICGGAFSGILQSLGRIDIGSLSVDLDVHATLLLLTLPAFAAPLLYMRLPDPVSSKKPNHHWLHVRREDLGLLTRALIPTVCIATGAGLSIQFLNLFFNSVHGMTPAAYSSYGTASNVLVLIAGLLVPEVRRRFGWRGAILGVQFIAVILLAAMGLTELWRAASWACPLAVVLFIFRQPLMSMAGPATSELTLAYVGPANHELISGFSGAIWSGSWWLAAWIFEHLRAAGMPYWQIFLVTSTLYLIGTAAYLGLIRATEKQASAHTGGDVIGGGEQDELHPAQREQPVESRARRKRQHAPDDPQA